MNPHSFKLQASFKPRNEIFKVLHPPRWPQTSSFWVFWFFWGTIWDLLCSKRVSWSLFWSFLFRRNIENLRLGLLRMTTDMSSLWCHQLHQGVGGGALGYFNGTCWNHFLGHGNTLWSIKRGVLIQGRHYQRLSEKSSVFKARRPGFARHWQRLAWTVLRNAPRYQFGA